MSARGALRIMIFGTGGPQTKSVAVWPLLGGTAALIVVLSILEGLIDVVFGDPWRWDLGPSMGIAMSGFLAPVLLQPIRHRWPALVGGLAALLLAVSVLRALPAPHLAVVAIGLLTGVATFAGITHLPAWFPRSGADPTD